MPWVDFAVALTEEALGLVLADLTVTLVALVLASACALDVVRLLVVDLLEVDFASGM